MKDVVEKEATQEEVETKEQEEEQTEDNIDLTATENGWILKWDYRSFMIPEMPKADIGGYVD